MRNLANLLSKTMEFVFSISIVLAVAGHVPQVLAQTQCPPSPAYTPDFTSKSCLVLNGTAGFPLEGPAVLQLTDSNPLGYETASAWYTTPQAVQNGFTSNFQFQFTSPSSPPADGIAFVIQNSSTSALGVTGGALGYGDDDFNNNLASGISNSLAIEFDTWDNTAWDPAPLQMGGNVSHVAVQSCGAGPNTSHHGQLCNVESGPSSTLGAPVLTSATLADGNVHTVTIKYSAACPACIPSTSANMHVILDGTDMYPQGVNVDLGSLLSLGETGTAYVGFTGATGGAWETQSILSWTFSSTSSAPETTYTTPTQTTTQGGSNQFTDGSGTTQTYAFPTTTSFQDDNGGSCASPTMAIQFQYWDPTVFNSSRLPGIPQNPNWCSVPGNPGLACSTPVPAGTTCAQSTVNGKNYCIVQEAQCFCGGTQLAHCNVTGTSGPILVSNAGTSPVATNPGLVIGDDAQNNWAVMPQSPDGSTCTTNCSTQKLNTDITILDVNQPDFSFTANPSTLNPGVGGSATSTLSMSGLYNFSLPVTLSVSGAPTGVTASLSPTVTPNLSTSPTTSTLTVSLGPSVMPGSFTLNVNGVNGSLNHYAFVTVNVAVDTTSISNLVTSLLNSGCIDNSGIANALTSKLSAAQGYINLGDNLDAINTLTAFKNQVSAQNGKHIHSSCPGWTTSPATVLTSDANSLITNLRVGMMADPITGYVTNSSGAGLQGATVSISGGTSTITATTDITGFYYFATTGGVLTSGSTYTLKVTGFPTGYTTSAPAYSTFTWSGSGFASNFTLNP